MSKRAELREGVRGGLFAAKWFSILAGIIATVRVLQGHVSAYTAFREYLAIVAIYVIGGVFGGLVAGALQRWVTNAWKSAIVGIVAIFPAAIAIRVAWLGFGTWTMTDMIAIPLIAIVWGGTMGAVYWNS